MRPIVAFLLRHGVTWDEFSDISKDVYVDVAREEYGIQGRPTNNSRVAMLTGLSRREVARIRDILQDQDESPVGRRGNRISEILTGWHADDEFVDDAGHPRVLPAEGVDGSLESLFRRFAGDLPHSALRKEMLQNELIEELSDGSVKVLKRDFTYSTLDPEIFEQMSVSLHDHAATLDHNLNEKRKGPARFEGIADNARISSRAARRFAELFEKRGMDFLNEMDTWLSDQETDEEKDASGRDVRLGVGVYLIYDEINERRGK